VGQGHPKVKELSRDQGVRAGKERACRRALVGLVGPEKRGAIWGRRLSKKVRRGQSVIFLDSVISVKKKKSMTGKRGFEQVRVEAGQKKKGLVSLDLICLTVKNIKRGLKQSRKEAGPLVVVYLGGNT